jgi:hypothetical protein
MSNHEEFFNNQPHDQPRIPNAAITEPLYTILPNTLLFPNSIKYKGAFAVDSVTNNLYLNSQAEISSDDYKPGISSSLPLIRILTIIDDDLVDGYVVDARDTSCVINVGKEDVRKINDNSIYLRLRLFMSRLEVNYR